MKHIFAYGTLQQKETQLRAIGREITGYIPAYTRGKVVSRMINDNICNLLIPSSLGNLVMGLLLPVEDNELPRIDGYEGALYERREVDIFDHNGRPHRISKAFAYLERKEEKPKPERFDWLRPRK